MNEQELHEKLSVDYFNQVWQLIETPSRNQRQNCLMREMAHASLFHWLKRADCGPTNVSVGLWQISRVHSLLGEFDIALHYAQECIETSKNLDAFYLAYAHEAAARAFKGLVEPEEQLTHYNLSKSLVPKIKDVSNAGFLDTDLAEIALSS